jgi:hypothetical protein
MSPCQEPTPQHLVTTWVVEHSKVVGITKDPNEGYTIWMPRRALQAVAFDLANDLNAAAVSTREAPQWVRAWMLERNLG